MSELIRPVFDETDDTEEILKQRETAVVYLGRVSVALCNASAESIHTINTIIGLNMKLRQHGVYDA
ncbi:hypothetical protein AHiyo8_58820 [Arthrobacter sp. Hiyo8]|uniref:hypothetical protein n=1 Tax=Arthrobacter sp. Hiyo1 TaxID=1588020 RepID=UPI000683847F|nr:hypothetical protein [Arthrobacter sp. Hiyo1]BAS17579.1 hypothetical protein AHiyo8_58820 [Arthrobacter sp. Hiyo8]GAP57938.1 hypothetical protein AHiyo1_09000 [Arthrobacter sp. Hiyo1]